MNGLRKKCEKPPFLAFWAKMANFGQFLAKMVKTGIFFKKPLGKFLQRFRKSNEQRDGQTDVIP